MSRSLRLRPIGVLSRPETLVQFRGHRQELLEHAGELSNDLRERCSDYLRAGTLIIAFMEQTTDVINEEFTVPGGSGIRSDGLYYWRQDAAQYVDVYGVGLDSEFLRHCERHDWVAPELSPAEVSEVDRALVQELGLRIRRSK
jgi:hypothetical protein